MSVWLWLFTACGADPGAAAAPGLGAAAAAGGAAAAAAAAGEVRSVDVAGLKAAVDGGAVKRLVDVRTAEEFAGGHVPGAINVPVDALAARLGELGPPGEVHVICQSGGRSARAAQTLAAKGFVAVNVTGGTGAWKAAGYAVETP